MRALLTFGTVLTIAALVCAPGVTAQQLRPETPVTVIALDGPAAQPNAEISGLAWFGDTLLLLLENPNEYAAGDVAGMFFALEKAEILAYLDAHAPAPLEPRPVPIYAPDIPRTLRGFDGFEAVVFIGDTAYLTAELYATPLSTFAVLVRGTVAPDLSAITLDLEHTVTLDAQASFPNQSYEALIATEDWLYAIYEANGAAVNAQPVAYAVDHAWTTVAQVSFPSIEYRVTDATAIDSDGVFWAVNYFFPGDTHLTAERDPLAERYGSGPTHAQFAQVERLVAFRIGADAGDPGAITWAEVPPLLLELPDDTARNWEGIARLDDRGFLLVTDRYPQTILGFVAAEMPRQGP